MGLGGRQAARIVLVVLFAVESVALISLGTAHLVRHGIETAAAYGLVPVVVGFLILVAAIDMIQDARRPARRTRRKPWQMVTVIASQASLIPVMLTPLWTEWNSGIHDRADWILCLVCLVPLLVALAILGMAVWEKPAGSLSRGWVVVAAVFPLASTAQFWYTTFYEPSRQRPTVDIVAEMQGEVAKDGTVRVTADITLENAGKTELIFFDALYTVTGFDLEPRTEIDRTQVEAALNGKDRVASNDLRDDYQGLVHIGRLIRAGGHLSEGQALTTSVAFDVDPGAADKLRLTVLASTLVGEGDLDVEAMPRESESAEISVCRFAKLPIQGWPRTQLADGPAALTMLVMPTDAVPSLKTQFFYPAGTNDDCATGDYPSDVREIYPYWNSRGFTTSVEYSMPR